MFAARLPNPPIHHAISAIEFILSHLSPKLLRPRQPSVSLFTVIITMSNRCDRVPLPQVSPQAQIKSEAVF
jgi:hypothetical protein